jgi:hypothetical protein
VGKLCNGIGGGGRSSGRVETRQARGGVNVEGGVRGEFWFSSGRSGASRSGGGGWAAPAAAFMAGEVARAEE